MRSKILQATKMFVLVVVITQGIAAGAAGLALQSFVSTDIIVETLMPRDHLGERRELLVALAEDLRGELVVMWSLVYAVAAVLCLAWILISTFSRVRTPDDVDRYMFYWLFCLGTGVVGVGLATISVLYQHPDLTTVAGAGISVLFVLGFWLLFWPLGTLWATPRVLAPVVWFASRRVGFS